MTKDEQALLIAIARLLLAVYDFGVDAERLAVIRALAPLELPEKS